jgi:hypothetical protein
MQGWLLAAPGLVAPAALGIYCVVWLVYQLMEDARYPESLLPGLGWFVSAGGVVVALLLFGPPLLVALPSRLQLWQAILAVLVQTVPLYVSAVSASLLGLLAFASFSYVPVLAAVRFLVARRSTPSLDTTENVP